MLWCTHHRERWYCKSRLLTVPEFTQNPRERRFHIAGCPAVKGREPFIFSRTQTPHRSGVPTSVRLSVPLILWLLLQMPSQLHSNGGLLSWGRGRDGKAVQIIFLTQINPKVFHPG